MKYCKDCVGFDECKTTGRTVEFAVDDGVCIDFAERKPQTNADRIRAMSDEELAVWLASIRLDMISILCKKFNVKIEIPVPTVENTAEMREWLQQPVENLTEV